MALAEDDDMVEALVGLSRQVSPHIHCQKQSTALVSLDRTQTFLIAHVFHPLYGRELQLIDQYLAWGEDRVCFRDGGGELRYLPTAWTSMAPPDPFVRTSAGRSHFRVAVRGSTAPLADRGADMARDRHGPSAIDQ